MPGLVCRCAAAFCKMPNVYTNFQPKLSEIMADNVEDRVMLPPKVAIFKEKVIIFVTATCNAIRDQYK